MEHRAGPLLANRSLSALIVASFVLSAFAGLYIVASPAPSAAQSGDLVITSGTYTIENIEQPVDGNVAVSGTGELIIRDGSLMVISNVGSPKTVTVSGGGKITLEHGVLTTYLDQIDPWPFLTLIIDGGTVTATDSSALRFPGSINIQNGGELSLYDSTIEKLSDAYLNQYLGGWTAAQLDTANDGPAISIDDATMMMFDSSISNLPEYPEYHMVAGNMTLTGESHLLAVNSYIDVDFLPTMYAADWYIHNVLVLSDESSAHLYGSYFEPFSGQQSLRAPAVVANGNSYIAMPTAKGPEDNTGQPISDLLASGDGFTYQVGPGQTMAIDAFSAGSPATVDEATLYVRYAVESTYNGAGSFTWRREGVGSPASTGITPSNTETSFVEKSFDLHAAGVTTTNDLGAIDINFVHTSTQGIVQVDSMFIVITIGPECYVYRWLDVSVGDEYGVPIPQCEISAVFTGSTTFGGQPSFYFGFDGVQSTPPLPVLDYMGVDASSFGVTNSIGSALMPLLTDLISGGEAPNSLFVGAFELTGTVEQDSILYSSTEAFSFPAYPAMESTDQRFAATVDVEDVSAESPDSSKWLVVPPDLEIADMEYYHAGDVIVASDGNLNLSNAVFRIVQTTPNEHTIYVDGTANFLVENSQIISALPVDIIVKGHGTLEVIGSTLNGVNIVAMESAKVILNESTMYGTIATSWNSEAHIMIHDSVLVQAPTLSGHTLCEVTNTSAPSITVLDSSVALIYRWIHITVYDGGNYPLEGADVYARFYVNQTIWTSVTTDPYGVARLKCLGTILTASGSTYVGQYRVNASYWSDGREIKEYEQISVSVLPYTEPLTENATYAVLRMPEVLIPDLVLYSSSVSTSPSEVVKDTECTILARIWNLGEKEARNVTVDFFLGSTIDTGELLGTYTIDIISKSSYRDASLVWTPEVKGLQTIWVEVNGDYSIDERTYVNNRAFIEVAVLDYANLVLGSVTFRPVGSAGTYTSIAGGTEIVVSADLSNVGEAPAWDISVRLTVTYGTTTLQLYETVETVIRQNVMIPVEFEYTLPQFIVNTQVAFAMAVNPAMAILETTYEDNNASANLMVLDVREDFKIGVSDVYIQYGVGNETDPVYGRTVTIYANVYNLGGTNPGLVTVEFGMTLFPTIPIARVNISVPQGSSVLASTDYLINITDGGTYTMYVSVDPGNVYSEKNETNNYAEIEMEIEQLAVDMSVSVGDEYEAEQDMVVTVVVRYEGTSEFVSALRGVYVELRDEDQNVVLVTNRVSTNVNGAASFSIKIPKEIESGTYMVVCGVMGLTDTTSVPVEIHGTVSGGDIPLLWWIIVIAAIAASVIGFTVYTYMYGVGKLVECGECGEFIPASNKRCPKCGVEFEVGTMKCSECGAWVPAESPECPNCGVKFVGEEVEEGDYLERMRKEYDEMTSKYRELAKAELGRKYSDKKFDEWWVAQPTYISFDDWLAKEEEKRKEGPVACPVCGTLNPKEATVCNRCGTVFAAAREAPQERGPPPQAPPPSQGPPPAAPVQYAQQPQAEPSQQPAAPKMVIRRPIDRKVVPKKVIRTPVSGEDQNGGEGQ